MTQPQDEDMDVRRTPNAEGPAKAAAPPRADPIEGPANPDADRGGVDPSTLSYEQARDELVEVVRLLESGQSTLEGSLALWERGEALAARCTEWLDGARARVDRAQRSTNALSAEAEPTVDADTATPATDKEQP